MNKPFLSFPSRTAAWVWLLACLCAGSTLLWLLPQSKINSSVLAMLPNQAVGTQSLELNDAFLQRLDKQLLWLVGTGKEPDPAAARHWQQQLEKTSGLSQVRGEMSASQQQEWAEFFWRYRHALLDSSTRERLQQGGTEQTQWVLSQLYSAFAGVSSAELTQDPLLLTRSIQLSLTQQAHKLQIKDGWLMTQDDAGNHWYLLRGELQGNSFDLTRTHDFVLALQQQKDEFLRTFAHANVLSRGTVFYSDFASQQAQRDISTLGTATVLGVILLIYWVFRSLRPLFLVSLSVAIGALFGALATLWIFHELHLITLVMSMSLIGISTDYAIYYLTERRLHGAQHTPQQSMARVRSALLFALATTVLAYLCIMLAPFPGIRQMAVFAAVGLSASCLTVLLWFPPLCSGMPVQALPLRAAFVTWLTLWQTRPLLRIGLPLALALLSLIGLGQLQVNDDISQLQAAPKHLQQEEHTIAALTGQNMDQKWFVVVGSSAQQTLEHMEQFAPALQQAKHQGWLADYSLLPLNSLHQQQADKALIQQAQPQMVAALSELGMNQSSIAASLDGQALTLSVEDWLSSPASEGVRLLWMSLPNGQSGVLIPVTGVQNSAALAELASTYTGVSWVDRKQSLDRLFSTYRGLLSVLLLLALGIVLAGAVLRLGWRHGLQSWLPTALSLSVALAVPALLGYNLNLFSLLALVLVLGIGTNYSIFFSNKNAASLTSMLAVLLAMLTTLLTLGMLVFSSTAAIQNFGLVLVIGIFVAFLLSPLALPKNTEVTADA